MILCHFFKGTVNIRKKRKKSTNQPDLTFCIGNAQVKVGQEDHPYSTPLALYISKKHDAKQMIHKSYNCITILIVLMSGVLDM